MAYIKKIDLRCALCTKKAKVELFNRKSRRLGAYCQSCGEKRLREQLVLEAEADAFSGEAEMVQAMKRILWGGKVE